jgi:hypothetical protein
MLLDITFPKAFLPAASERTEDREWLLRAEIRVGGGKGAF